MSNQQPQPLLRARTSTALLTVTALCVLLVASQWSVAPTKAETPPPLHMLLKLSPQAWETPELFLSNHGLSHWERLRVPGWVRVTLVSDQDRTRTALYGDLTVQAMEQDHRVQIALAPNDREWGFQWGPRVVRAPSAWDVTTGSQNIVVAVLDTGIDQQHVDLVGQLWVNPAEVPGNGQDDDKNGQIDDVHGWRFLHDPDGPDQSALIDDDHGHGTHVSGIIAARGNNEQGVAGMAWGSRVMVVKVLDQNGDGYYSDLASGLIYAADNGARVANLSVGGAAPSQMLQDAVDYAYARGTLVVASAGNSNSDIQYPAACRNALAVSASTPDDGRASYSCYGPEMDLAAPGSGILSTCLQDRYCYKSGTSMAAPHVAGLAALLLSESPGYTPAQVAQLLRDSAEDIGATGWDPQTGWGRIDALRAVLRTQTRFDYYFPMVQIGRRSPGALP